MLVFNSSKYLVNPRTMNNSYNGPTKIKRRLHNISQNCEESLSWDKPTVVAHGDQNLFFVLNEKLTLILFICKELKE